LKNTRPERLSPNAGEFTSGLLWRLARAGLTERNIANNRAGGWRNLKQDRGDGRTAHAAD